LLTPPIIETERLVLRPWRAEDLPHYSELNADPRVREFFPGVLTETESDAEVSIFKQRFERDGFGLLAAELRETGACIGFIGMQTMSFAVPGLAQPAVEIGWRLAARYWGQGLATEGARAVLEYGFETVRLREVVAITVPANTRSRRVMEKIGMRPIPGLNFAHPRIAEGHPLQAHVLYMATRNAGD
jgi:RimJ/RimL family protein N-acetyltransferase